MPGPLDGLLGRSSLRDPARGRRAAEIAALVRSLVEVPEGVAVTVQQLSCSEPGCPPVETVIAVLGTPPRRWTIHRPLAAGAVAATGTHIVSGHRSGAVRWHRR